MGVATAQLTTLREPAVTTALGAPAVERGDLLTLVAGAHLLATGEAERVDTFAQWLRGV